MAIILPFRQITIVALLLGCAGRTEPAPAVIEPLPTPHAQARTVAPPLRTPPRSVLEARDPRTSSRSAELITTEVLALQRILAATPTSSPDRPRLLRRLAEEYAERRRVAHDPADGREAIRHYTMLVDEYPEEPSIDEVLYDLGLEYELGGQMSDAQQTYFKLIAQKPASTYIPAAYFAFGEMFVEAAKTDPSKLDIARQAFIETLKWPKSELYPWALLRLGQVAERMGDQTAAQTSYTRLRTSRPDSDAAARIGDPL